MQCPLCFKSFHRDLINHHAATCLGSTSEEVPSPSLQLSTDEKLLPTLFDHTEPFF